MLARAAFNLSSGYSVRRATVGSICAARHAGTTAAIAAAVAMTAAAASKGKISKEAEEALLIILVLKIR